MLCDNVQGIFKFWFLPKEVVYIIVSTQRCEFLELVLDRLLFLYLSFTVRSRNLQLHGVGVYSIGLLLAMLIKTHILRVFRILLLYLLWPTLPLLLVNPYSVRSFLVDRRLFPQFVSVLDTRSCVFVRIESYLTVLR